ncbi:hypothetical protein BGZ61DRAFT_451552 [Ilyonectria robusta]|uniref:uncharacterized protein n=1 Tax=Ilyonectria robusta TaxID=1079257 RepID=UPI001E8DABFA|nr:uncharacterized protein BGZ61DRAFT_451552 [Ilyonectria robusta]KAH8699910.1 hypothetical protein BGZ61DRAFT_451552 [Ilyonectria robusta]
MLSWSDPSPGSLVLVAVATVMVVMVAAYASGVTVAFSSSKPGVAGAGDTPILIFCCNAGNAVKSRSQGPSMR